MSGKDKRTKGCPEPGCARHNEHYKYKPDDMFCTLCGSQLVYVCAKCFKEIEDTGDQRRYCEECKPKKSKDGAESQKPAKKEKKEKKESSKPKQPPKEKKEKREKKSSGKGKEAVSRSVAVIKGKAPQIKERAIKIASDPKVQRAALEVADIAKEGIRHRKTRRVIGVLIRAARK